uniref:tRNA-uridine aminocarboxypropyltransferase 1 n=1 Tax=Elaeophora elaphi TaxID=1147741 RepID=A0A0R3S0B7_9BILA
MDRLKISDCNSLEGLKKQVCSNCGRRRMYYCYNCKVYMPDVEQLVPRLELPIRIDIIKHRQEKNSKSTALHCLLLAPSSTTLYDSLNVPDYNSPSYKQENTVLVVYSKNAYSVNDFVKKRGPIRRFVFLDSTWFQIGGLKLLPQLQYLPIVTLRSYKTKYWRPQRGLTDYHLATIEAIYYALREAFEASCTTEYDGCFDDLLFWFFIFRSKVDKSLLKGEERSTS